MVRSMISGKKMPKKFWPEAVLWSCYPSNRCPTSSVEGVTPHESYNGRKPTVAHLRVWGCLVHVHLPKVERDKLDNRSRTYIFISINEGTKGYRLYNVLSEKVVINRDVLFKEDKQWNWDGNQGEQKVSDLEWNDANDIALLQEEAHTGRVATGQGRITRQPVWINDYVSKDNLSDDEVNMALSGDIEDPMSFEEANQEGKWRKAIQSEMNSIERNNTWSLTDLPPGSKKVGVKWIYKTKTDETGIVTKHKARFVAKGYSQKEGVDYSEVFTPVARMDIIRMIVSITIHKEWKIYQLDVKSAFLQEEIEEEIEEDVYMLIHHLILSVYVDDLIFTGDNQDMMMEFKESMVNVFDMSDLDSMNYFLGIEVRETKIGIFICQKKYAEDVLKRFMSRPNDLYFQLAKRVLRYLKGAIDLGIYYQRTHEGGELQSYIDSDYVGDKNDRKSTSGYTFILSNGAVVWSSKK
ncbi:transmembrane signal receptor [Lithospermum erythrorhizon]|uniref:Transmembrane signal receptor n=1 Tax=Lithospermum erythrorhizon TaxID=34254 RepID=A0AAV3NW19_LITER